MEEELEMEETEMEEEVEIDLSLYAPSLSKGASRLRVGTGVMTIVNTINHGKRIILSKKLMKELAEPENLQLSFGENEIVIGGDLPDNEHYFKVRSIGAKGVIYSTDLVREISEKFNLDFSKRVSITLNEVNYLENEYTKVAIISVP